MTENDRTDWLDPAVDPRTASPKTITTNTPTHEGPAVSGTGKKTEPLPHRRKK